jgi:hypothetical protein
MKPALGLHSNQLRDIADIQLPNGKRSLAALECHSEAELDEQGKI